MIVHIVDFKSGDVLLRIKCTVREFLRLPHMSFNAARVRCDIMTDDLRLIDVRTGEIKSDSQPFKPVQLNLFDNSYITKI